jgi:hypothetical protein
MGDLDNIRRFINLSLTDRKREITDKVSDEN